VDLRFQRDGQTVSVPARKWVRHVKDKTELPSDWVFAGSQRFPDPLDPHNLRKPWFYDANRGDVFCVTNFEAALLDVPFESPGGTASGDLLFETFTERIPPVETPVVVVLSCRRR
jgi:hypothetical protein